MERVVYLKKVDDYEEILKKSNTFLKSVERLIFLFKNIFNIITLKEKKLNICILPIKEKVSGKKLSKMIEKISKNKKLCNAKFAIANHLLKENILDILDQYHLSYFNGKSIQKILIFKKIEYINALQHKRF